MLLQMLFVEGNHFCPSCEKSGDCLLQARAYELGMTGPGFEEFYPTRRVDTSHPTTWLDLNRCILCKLCVRASHEIDRKDVFAIGGHGIGTRIVVDSPTGRLGDSAFESTDFAATVCPVGAILPKRRGFAVPIGERRFDRHAPTAPPTAPPTDASPTAPAPARRLRVATVSLAGCFGCHMSMMDLDERLFELFDRIELDRSPLTDLKHCGPCDVGLVEGGLCNAENVHVLREFRARCRVLVAVGACAINGGLPAQRNALDVGRVLVDVYRARPGLAPDAAVPDDPELPLPLARVHPIHEVVHVDHFLPGCPPSADAIWRFLEALLDGREPVSDRASIRYD